MPRSSNAATHSWSSMGRSLLGYAAQVALISFLAFYLLESFFPGFVSSYINLGTALLGVLLLLVLDITLPSTESNDVKYRVNGPLSTRFIVVVAVGVTIVLFARMIGLGWVGLIIAAIGGLAVAYISRDLAGADLPGSDDDRRLRP